MWSFISVNALDRATPISTMVDVEKCDDLDLCQCPGSGYSYFYEEKK